MGYVYTKQFSSHYKQGEQYIGVVGHIDHGKSTLLYNLINKFSKTKVKFSDIFDRALEEKERGITINQRVINIPYKGKVYNFIDFPGHANYINTVVKGLSHCYGIVLVVSAADSVMSQTREVLYACKQAKIMNLVVYLSKTDEVDDNNLVDIVKGEIQDTLAKYGYKNSFITSDLVELMTIVSRWKKPKQVSEVFNADTFVGELYLSTREEGGRHKPIFTGFRPTFIIGDKAVTGTITYTADCDMVEPGDYLTIGVKLDKPTNIDFYGGNIIVRDQGRTIGSVSNIREIGI